MTIKDRLTRFAERQEYLLAEFTLLGYIWPTPSASSPQTCDVDRVDTISDPRQMCADIGEFAGAPCADFSIVAENTARALFKVTDNVDVEQVMARLTKLNTADNLHCGLETVTTNTAKGMRVEHAVPESFKTVYG